MFDLFLSCLTKNYAKISGRATRKEYWSFLLFSVLFGALFSFLFLWFVAAVYGAKAAGDVVANPLFTLVVFVVLGVPAVTLEVRRCHDVGFSTSGALAFIIPSLLNTVLSFILQVILYVYMKFNPVEGLMFVLKLNASEFYKGFSVGVSIISLIAGLALFIVCGFIPSKAGKTTKTSKNK